MPGVVFASQADLVATVVAVESWRAVSNASVSVVVDHVDLIGPLRDALPGVAVEAPSTLGALTHDRIGALATLLSCAREGEVLAILPATSVVHREPTSLIAAAQEHGVAVAVRGQGEPPARDQLRPTPEDLASCGPLHLEVVALRAGDERAEAFVAWASSVPEADRAALLPVLRPGVALVSDPGLAVGWWNLHDRPLATDGAGWTAGGAPLSVFDFRGWRPEYGHMVHPDMTRLRGSEDPALRDLVDDYAARWRAARQRVDPDVEVWPEDAVLRALLEQAPEQLRAAALANEDGAREAFLTWAENSDREDTLWGVSRYLLQVRRDRFDLQVAFPDLDDPAVVRAYLDWCSRDGVGQGIPQRFINACRVPPADISEPLEHPAHGVNVIGLFDEPALGVAEIARQVRSGLEHAGIRVAPVTVDRRGRLRPQDGEAPLPYDITLACVNADLFPAVHRRLGSRLPASGTLVGLWWWELSAVPEMWQPAIDLVDEVWAGTTFVADAFRSAFDGPVRLVPLGLGGLTAPGTLPDAVAADPRPFVLVTFDYSSQIARKNPLGAIEAYVRSGIAPDVRLVVKTVNGGAWPRDAERVRLAAIDAGLNDVLLIDGAVSAAEQAALVDRAAAFLSLHRSEGLGLTIVEAMLRGTPVIATDYGGSTDILDAATGWPIPYRPAAVGAGAGLYPADAEWAAPDAEAAAIALREVVAGGTKVEERVAAAQKSAEQRAARLDSGVDLAEAVRASRSNGRTTPHGGGAERQSKRWRLLSR